MKGIVFTGGEGPEPQTVKGLLGDLAGALIAAADSGLALAEAAGIKPDWIVGDMDSLDNGERLNHYPKERVICYPVDKDYTDTEIALALLWEKGCNDVWIIGGGGGRLDHLFGIRSLFERADPPQRWITAVDDIYCIDPLCQNVSGVVSKQFNSAVFPVSVFPLGTGPWEAESSGLKWSLKDLTWGRDFIAISNEAEKGGFTITAKQGRFMVIAPIAVQ